MSRAEFTIHWQILEHQVGKLLCLIGMACAIFPGFSGLPAKAQTPSVTKETHVDGRGTRALAYALMLQYGKSITVEEPILRWEGDVGSTHLHPERPDVPVRRIQSRPMALPKWLNIDDSPTLNMELIQRLLDEYHRQNPSGPRYRVTTSDVGFHIVPEQEHDAQGQLVVAKPLLDTVITVPWGRRLASEHFEAVRAVLEKASGIKVEGFAYQLDAIFAANGLRPPKYFPPESREAARATYGFDWSVDAKTAREALLDLWRRSATSLYWSSLCEPNLEGPGTMCILSLMGVPEAYPISDGVTGTRVRMFDRVAKEPQFLRQTAPRQ